MNLNNKYIGNMKINNINPYSNKDIRGSFIQNIVIFSAKKAIKK